MKYFAPALCALLATLVNAQEDASGTEASVAERPTFTVRQYRIHFEDLILTAYSLAISKHLSSNSLRTIGKVGGSLLMLRKKIRKQRKTGPTLVNGL